MKKTIYIIFYLIIISKAYSQVGIGTTDPKANLHINASNSSSPLNSDGLIIPRVSTFPTINPTEIGIEIFHLGNATVEAGYYFWDGVQWRSLKSIPSNFSATSSAFIPNNSTNLVFITDVRDNAFFDFHFLINCYSRNGKVYGQIVDGVIHVSKFYSFISNAVTDEFTVAGQVTNNGTNDVTIGNNAFGNIRLVMQNNKLYWVPNYNACGSSIKLVAGNVFYIDSSNTLWKQSGSNIYFNIGNVGIGTSAPNASLDVVGDILFSGKISNLSDERIKKNIENYDDGLDVLLKLNPVKYQYNNLYDKKIDTNQVHIGLIAQDVEKHAPYLIDEINKETEIGKLDLKAVKYNDIILLLINSIKELNNKIEKLENQIKK